MHVQHILSAKRHIDPKHCATGNPGTRPSPTVKLRCEHGVERVVRLRREQQAVGAVKHFAHAHVARPIVVCTRRQPQMSQMSTHSIDYKFVTYYHGVEKNEEC